MRIRSVLAVVDMRSFLLSLFPLFAISCAHLSQQPTSSLQRYREARYVMGSILDITVYHDKREEVEQFFDDSFRLVETLDSILSTYKPTSEISKLNASGIARPVALSPLTCELVRRGLQAGLQTEGAFALSIRPLVNLWQEAATRYDITRSEIKRTQQRVGDHQLVLSQDCVLSRNSSEHLAIETGGIGKGFAVDKILEVLKQSPINAALINFGLSSIYAHGTPPRQSGWRLLIAFPGRDPLGEVEVSNQALSASFSHGSETRINGKRYGHIIDPTTGSPLIEESVAVVIGPSATDAEVFSKYLVIRSRSVLPKGSFDWYRGNFVTTSCSEGFPVVSGFSCQRSEIRDPK
jgi:FAD:protein FMN transferase